MDGQEGKKEFIGKDRFLLLFWKKKSGEEKHCIGKSTCFFNSFPYNSICERMKFLHRKGECDEHSAE